MRQGWQPAVPCKPIDLCKHAIRTRTHLGPQFVAPALLGIGAIEIEVLSVLEGDTVPGRERGVTQSAAASFDLIWPVESVLQIRADVIRLRDRVENLRRARTCEGTVASQSHGDQGSVIGHRVRPGDLAGLVLWTLPFGVQEVSGRRVPPQPNLRLVDHDELDGAAAIP